MRVAAGTERQRRLRCLRSGLVVQGFGAASKTAENPAEAETADDAGAAAGRLPSGAERAGRETIGRCHSGARSSREPGIQRLLREIPGSPAQERERPGMTGAPLSSPRRWAKLAA